MKAWELQPLPRLFPSCRRAGHHPPGCETVTYYHNDALGSPVAATDASGNLLWRETYRPYGERLNNQIASSNNPIWYTGKRQDAETGLVYMGSRYYDPRLGRFLSIDPVEPDENNLHSLNRYAYANNNPYKFTDPDGQIAETIIDVVSLGMSINAFRQDPSFINGLAVAYDGFATAVPFLPAGLGIIRQAASKGEKLTEIVKQAADRGAARAGEGAQKVEKSESLWSTAKNKSAVENAFGHWNKHKSEFPELQNAKQYAERAKDFLTNPPKGTLTKTNSRGDTLRYDPGTNTFGVLDKDGAPRTMFRPKEGMSYWNRQ